MSSPKELRITRMPMSTGLKRIRLGVKGILGIHFQERYLSKYSLNFLDDKNMSHELEDKKIQI